MSEILSLLPDEITPGRDAALQNQGIPPGAVVSSDIESVYARAIGLLGEKAKPAGVLKEITKDEFALVYHGEGRNEPQTPVGDIYASADFLALFAVTLGPQVSEEIDRRFRSNDFALGSMLDSVASAAADQAAERVEHYYRDRVDRGSLAGATTALLRYSPGYCGWHISGQKRLFDFLEPRRIGLHLRDSFLMEPLKSVSGVIIAGPPEIHDFADRYPFCDRCETHGCRERIRGLRAG